MLKARTKASNGRTTVSRAPLRRPPLDAAGPDNDDSVTLAKVHTADAGVSFSRIDVVSVIASVDAAAIAAVAAILGEEEVLWLAPLVEESWAALMFPEPSDKILETCYLILMLYSVYEYTFWLVCDVWNNIQNSRVEYRTVGRERSQLAKDVAILTIVVGHDHNNNFGYS